MRGPVTIWCASAVASVTIWCQWNSRNGQTNPHGDSGKSYTDTSRLSRSCCFVCLISWCASFQRFQGARMMWDYPRKRCSAPQTLNIDNDFAWATAMLEQCWLIRACVWARHCFTNPACLFQKASMLELHMHEQSHLVSMAWREALPGRRGNFQPWRDFQADELLPSDTPIFFVP